MRDDRKSKAIGHGSRYGRMTRDPAIRRPCKDFTLSRNSVFSWACFSLFNFCFRRVMFAFDGDDEVNFSEESARTSDGLDVRLPDLAEESTSSSGDGMGNGQTAAAATTASSSPPFPSSRGGGEASPSTLLSLRNSSTGLTGGSVFI